MPGARPSPTPAERARAESTACISELSPEDQLHAIKKLNEELHKDLQKSNKARTNLINALAVVEADNDRLRKGQKETNEETLELQVPCRT